MSSHRIKIERAARIETLGSIQNADLIVIALHGYGQLARYFIQKFRNLDPKIAVIAPEGFHRFYLNGSSGRVGASWMTKEDRELDISENMTYLNSVHETFLSQIGQKKTVLLGFSQGAATAARWYFMRSKQIDHLVMWASVFPPDLELPNSSTVWNTDFFVIGDEDPYFYTETREEVIQHYAKIGFEIIRYKGDHTLNDTVFQSILNRITN